MVYPDELKEAILAQDFQCFIDSVYPTDKPELIFENQGKDIGDISKMWISFACNLAYRKSTTLGTRRKYLRKGVISILIGVPSGTLTSDMQEVIQNIINHYEGKKIEDIYIRDINEGLGNYNDTAWFTRSLTVSFEYYITK